ncbi:hypothetical protein [Lysobacter sp. CA199]|uniref:hypothetical protein n=1 Tax=Lysobacter sp. CA199 TaxID=3455608 RepID=UPI003F8CF745
MERVLFKVFGIAALIGLVVSLVVHVATCLGVDLSVPMLDSRIMPIAIFVISAPFVYYTMLTPASQSYRLGFSERIPRWAKLAGGLLVAYALINSFALGGGSPEIRQGGYVLIKNGRVLWELTPEQYRVAQLSQLRRASGFWLTFYFLAVLWFLLPRKA